MDESVVRCEELTSCKARSPYIVRIRVGALVAGKGEEDRSCLYACASTRREPPKKMSVAALFGI